MVRKRAGQTPQRFADAKTAVAPARKRMVELYNRQERRLKDAAKALDMSE
jgi:hypothetical protein